ncbi:MAG TPA: signal peptidase I [Allosphingosinicella sp.]
MTDPDRIAAADPAPGTAAAPVEPARAAPPAKAEKKGTDWWGELKAIFWLILAVLAFHSFVAKPFYIPSESMMPVLLKGDRLVVSKFPYGWSWVSPSFHIFPRTEGRLWGEMPRRGDIVIVTPPGQSADYIKRVIGLPGDTIELIDGQVYLNAQPLRREERAPAMLPVDPNLNCRDDSGTRVTGADGRAYCRLRIFREYLPDGRYYDTIDSGYVPQADDFPRVRVPANHVFLMGDNRDHSADSRFPAGGPNGGLGGPVPWENLGGRAEFITFSLDGSSSYLNPISWFTALRGGRAGSSLHPRRVEQPQAPAR